MTDLPKGWTTATLGDVLATSPVFTDGDWVETKDQDPDGEVRLTQLADVGVGAWRDRSARFMPMDRARAMGCTFLEPGDVLVARMPEPLGRACLFPGDARPCVTAVDVCVIRADHNVLSARWLMWALNSPHAHAQISARQSGTTRKRISRKNLASIVLPLPPRSEQDRIVAAIEEQFSRVASADGALASAARRTVSLRAGVLARVLDGTFAAKRIGDVFEVYVGTTPPRGDPSLWNGGVPWVSSGEVAFCRVRQTRETISREAVGPDRIHPPGTVLLAMIGEGKTRGQAAILDVAAAHNQNSAAIRIDPTVALPEWVYYVLMARYADTRRVGSGNNQPALNKSRVREIEIPLPPLDEQQQVIGDLERQLSLVDALVPAIEHASVRSKLLRRAVLVEAFSGRLVPQDPSDEPASELLARIAAERPAASKPRQRKRV